MERMKTELQRKLSALNQNEEIIRNANKGSLEKTLISKESNSAEKFDYRESIKLQKEKEKIANEFISKIQKDQKELRKRLELKLKKEQELNKTREEERIKAEKEAELKIRAERREELFKTYELNRQKFKEEKNKLKEIEKSYPFPKVYLYDQIEERYKNDIVLPMVKEENFNMQKRHINFRPVRKEDLIQHQASFENYKMKRIHEKNEEINKRKVKDIEYKRTIKKYSSNISIKVKTMDLEKGRNENKKLLERRNMRTKMQNYSELIKVSRPVIPSKEKELELQQLIGKINTPVKQPKDVKDLYDVKKINEQYKQLMKRIKERNNIKSKSEGTYSLLNKSKDEKKEGNSRKYYDYLAEAKNKRRDKMKLLQVRNNNLSFDNVNFDSIKDMEKIERQIKIMEERTKLNEKLLEIQRGQKKDVEINGRISEMFINTIKAKLSLLENM